MNTLLGQSFSESMLSFGSELEAQTKTKSLDLFVSQSSTTSHSQSSSIESNLDRLDDPFHSENVIIARVKSPKTPESSFKSTAKAQSNSVERLFTDSQVIAKQTKDLLNQSTPQNLLKRLGHTPSVIL